MIMCTLSIEIPDEILLNVHKTQDEVALYMKQLYAVDLYKKKQVSLGYCAALAEMSIMGPLSRPLFKILRVS